MGFNKRYTDILVAHLSGMLYNNSVDSSFLLVFIMAKEASVLIESEHVVPSLYRHLKSTHKDWSYKHLKNMVDYYARHIGKYTVFTSGEDGCPEHRILLNTVTNGKRVEGGVVKVAVNLCVDSSIDERDTPRAIELEKCADDCADHDKAKDMLLHGIDCPRLCYAIWQAFTDEMEGGVKEDL